MHKWLPLVAGVMFAGLMIAQDGTDQRVSAQNLRLLPEEISDEEWETFTESLRLDEDYRRNQNFKRSEMEPLIAQWEKDLNAVFVAEWREFLDEKVAVESADENDNIRWSIETQTYNMRYGRFEVPVLKQFGGGEFSRTRAIPKDKLDEVSFEYLVEIRQGTPFDKRVGSISTQNRGADTVIADLCELVDADYSLPSQWKSDGTEGRMVNTRFRNRSVRDCIHKVAASAGWSVRISDGDDALPAARSVTLTHVEQWLETRNKIAEADTDAWRTGMKRMLDLKWVEIDTEELFVHAWLPRE